LGGGGSRRKKNRESKSHRTKIYPPTSYFKPRQSEEHQSPYEKRPEGKNNCLEKEGGKGKTIDEGGVESEKGRGNKTTPKKEKPADLIKNTMQKRGKTHEEKKKKKKKKKGGQENRMSWGEPNQKSTAHQSRFFWTT